MVHASHALNFPKTLHTREPTVSKRPLRIKRTEISSIYKHDSSEKTLNKNNTSSKLEPGKDVVSTDLLNQYNEIVGTSESLSYKRLPPVKVSYQSTKHKFIESPHVEGTSRIIRPHLTMKTYSPGHHIFTEGISKSSMVRSPTFSLQQVGVPYSNLPDNISVFKEKDKFAFGVKIEEFEKSPYRLTPKPFKFESTAFIPTMLVEPGKTDPNGEKIMKAKSSSRSTVIERPQLELKSNVIKLEPLATKGEKDSNKYVKCKSEFNTDIVKVPAGFTRPAKSPIAPSNSFYLTETEPDTEASTSHTEIKETDTESGEQVSKLRNEDRKLSVVSIGETVGPGFYENKKRETRQQYPMYDNTARRNENFRRKKFEYSEDFIFKAKPHMPTSTFTYKVSMQGMAFLQDKPADMFKPIRNNLRDRNGNIIHKQRGLGKYLKPTKVDDDSRNSSDYNFRRYYRRVFRRPKSSDSVSTEFSQLPGNPPPSEISHILSEDAPMLVNDIRNGMVTLVEERTLTASMISPRKENTPVDVADQNIKEINENPESMLTSRTLEDTETCTDTDVQFENALKTIERYNEQEIESSRTDIKENIGHEALASAAGNIKELDCERSLNDNSSKCDSAVVEQYIAEAEERIKSISETDDLEKKKPNGLKTELITQLNKAAKLDPIDENQTNQKNVHAKNSNSTKQYLAVPTLSLDSINYNPPLQLGKERTSLSRSLQNLTITNDVKSRDVTGIFSTLTSTEKGDDTAVKTGKENRTTLPVARLRLFSDTSTVSVKAPSVSVTDENGDLFDVMNTDLGDSIATDQSTKEKKVVFNANIPFIYPSTSEVKAKRQ